MSKSMTEVVEDYIVVQRDKYIAELEAENQEFAAEIRHLSERMSELLTQNGLMREALKRCYQDLIHGDFDPETSAIVRKLLEQSDD